MKVTGDCRPCLSRLVRQAAERATEDPTLRAKAIEEGLNFLDKEFSLDKTSIYVSTRLHRIIRRTTNNPDPYLQMKETEVEMAKDLIKTQKPNPDSNLNDCLKYAVKGNSIDFFRDLKTVEKEMLRAVEFSRDDSAILGSMLKTTKSILYLADNTGEVLFDLPLIKMLEEYAPVTYVVKESPVQNDITLADLDHFGMSGELTKVITTGTDTPGVDMSIASDEFKEAFEQADLVLAKGMGYWESLSELPAEGKIFFLLKAKCQPVANSLGVPLNSCVAMIR